MLRNALSAVSVSTISMFSHTHLKSSEQYLFCVYPITSASGSQPKKATMAQTRGSTL